MPLVAESNAAVEHIAVVKTFEHTDVTQLAVLRTRRPINLKQTSRQINALDVKRQLREIPILLLVGYEIIFRGVQCDWSLRQSVVVSLELSNGY